MNAAEHHNHGELELIRRLREILATPDAAGTPPAVPFGDDMAAVESGGDLLWTVDLLQDGVDFDSSIHDWHSIGRKAMAVNLSDCAAMAVQPLAALCALSLSDALTIENALDLVRGAQACGQRYGCPIVGGDTNSWVHPTVVSITIAARPEPGRAPISRDRARHRDHIWLSGQIGGSLLGRHMTFEPRVELALQIRRLLEPHAMIDVSDGLALDLGRVLEASGTGAVLQAEALERAIHPDARRLAAQDATPALDHALHDGEDFELLVVVDSGVSAELCTRLGLLDIGMIREEPGLFLRQPSGSETEIPIRGWEHFR